MGRCSKSCFPSLSSWMAQPNRGCWLMYHPPERFLRMQLGRDGMGNDEPRAAQQTRGTQEETPSDCPALRTICTSTSASPRGAAGLPIWVSSTQTLPSSKKDKEKHINASKHLWPSGSPSQGHPTFLLMEQTAQPSARTDPTTLTVQISSRTTFP